MNQSTAHTLATKIEVLALEFREYLQELLHKAHKLSGQVVLILGYNEIPRLGR